MSQAAPPVSCVYKGESLAEYRELTHRIFEFPEGTANMNLAAPAHATTHFAEA